MSKVYILCKEDRYEGYIQYIIKVFSDQTQALKSLYKYTGFKDDKFNFDNSYFILVKTVDQESEESGSEDEEEYENVYDFRDIAGYITRYTWQKVIDELPEKNTLRNLIKFQREVREYKKQEKKITEDIVERKKNMDIRKELDEKLDELNIKMPKLQV
jgi:hypothetical protein